MILLGHGRIGALDAAKVCSPADFEAVLVATDTHADLPVQAVAGEKPVLRAKSRQPVVGAGEFARVKPGVIVVNTAQLQSDLIVNKDP